VTPSLSTFSQRDIRGERKRKKGGKEKRGKKGRKSHVRLKWLYIQNKDESCEEAHEEIVEARAGWWGGNATDSCLTTRASRIFSPTLHYPKRKKPTYEFLGSFEPGPGRWRNRLSRPRS
jgi:hypothetical protein